MKIAVYHNLISGGNKRSLYETVKGMKEYGHSVDIYNLNISNEKFASLDELADKVFTYNILNVEFHGILKVMNHLVQMFQLVFLRRKNREIAKIINNSNYDLVWVSNCYLTQHPFILRYLKKPHILYTAEHFRAFYDRFQWKRNDAVSICKRILLYPFHLCLQISIYIKAQIDAKNINKTKNILVNSYFTRENILRFYGRNSKTLYLGVDLDKFCYKNVKKENLILSVGSLSSNKGHDLVMKSLVHLPKSKRPKLIIIADREDSRSAKAHIEKLAVKHGLNVNILRNISDKEVVELYNMGKITICANILEPFGLVPLESMACGVPVIAVREGGFRETINHQVTGLLVDRDETVLSQAIEYLLDNDEKRTSLGKNAMEFVKKNFGLNIYWPNMEKQIQSVANNNTLNYDW